MADISDATDDRYVYAVRPEPPQFDELVRRPDPVECGVRFHPPGPIRRRLGASRMQLLFRIGLIVAIGLISAAALF